MVRNPDGATVTTAVRENESASSEGSVITVDPVCYYRVYNTVYRARSEWPSECVRHFRHRK